MERLADDGEDLIRLCGGPLRYRRYRAVRRKESGFALANLSCGGSTLRPAPGGIMQPYRFAIVGAGWRAEFFFRIAAALPERFHIAGLVVRDPEKGRRVEA